MEVAYHRGRFRKGRQNLEKIYQAGEELREVSTSSTSSNSRFISGTPPKMLQIKTSIPGIVAEEFALRVITLHLPLRSKGKRERVKVLLNGSELNVEPATKQILEQSGYEVLRGEDVHIAGHVLTGKFMGLHEYQTFKNWARHYGYKERYLDQVLSKSDQLLRSYLNGNRSVHLQLLQSLVERWNIYYTPVQERKDEIRILIEFWKVNTEIFDRWIQWYDQLTYDPGGAPDLFVWDRQSNNWSWIEVKSLRDHLSAEQWWWIQQFVTNVAPNMAILRMLPSD